jgi:hypothetical protein
MTSQTKKFIELSDIVGLRVKCRNPKCDTSLIVGDTNILSIADPNKDVLFQCPSCGTGWTVPSVAGGAAYPGSDMGFDKEVKSFLRMLINMREYQKKLGCDLTFEIRNEPKE